MKFRFGFQSRGIGIRTSQTAAKGHVEDQQQREADDDYTH